MKFTLSLARCSLFAALTVFSSGAARAACDRPVDPSRATIYIGLNQSILENVAAEEAACLRGETFIEIPKPVAGADAAVVAMGNKVRLESTVKRLKDERNEKCIGDNASAADCQELATKITAAENQKTQAESAFNEYWSRLTSSVSGVTMLDLYTDKLRELASKNVRIKTLIFSGHSGGNGVWGSLGLGGIQFEPVQNRIATVFAEKKHLLSELKTVLLWGCNTINPYSSPASWVKFHPGLTLLFGFQGSAPSAKNPASPALLRSTMLAEKEIPKILKLAAPEEEIQKLFDGLKGISHTIGSAFVNLPGKDKGWYYERTFKRDTSVTPNVDTWVSKVSGTVMCESIRDQLSADQALAQRYMDGQIAIPADTSSGELRDLYSTARRNEECRKRLNFRITADQIGYLLFWNDVKKNAARLLSPRLTSQMEKLAKLNVASEIQAAVEKNNKNEAYTRAQNIKFMQQSIDLSKADVKRISYKIEALQEISASYKWTERDERRMNKLQEKIRKFSMKAKKAKKVEKLQTELDIQSRIKEIAQSSDPANRLKYALLYLNENKNYYTTEITRIEGNMKAVQPSKSPSEQAAGIAEKLNAILNGIPKLDVSGIAPMSISDLRSKLGAALELVASAKKVTSNSYAFSTINNELGELESSIKNYNKIAIELRSECLDFPTWHEYLENPAEAPRSNCSY